MAFALFSGSLISHPGGDKPVVGSCESQEEEKADESFWKSGVLWPGTEWGGACPILELAAFW